MRLHCEPSHNGNVKELHAYVPTTLREASWRYCKSVDCWYAARVCSKMTRASCSCITPPGRFNPRRFLKKEKDMSLLKPSCPSSAQRIGSRRPHLRQLLPALGLSFMCMASQADMDGEHVPADEASDIATITDLIKASVQEEYDKTGHAVRDAHRKAHGCVQATFTVLDGLPPKLSQGLFAVPRSYPAVIRFSNGSGKSQDDRVGDARGMAVKVLEVPGRKLVVDAADGPSQDFIMVNHPVFFVRNASDYVGFQRAIEAGGFKAFGWFLGHLFHETGIILAIRSKEVNSPLDIRYWSMTASRLGAEQMKFSAVPCNGATFAPTRDSPDHLGESLREHLGSNAACFDFMVQTRDGPDKMPIEDPTVEWQEQFAPFAKVARIDIRPQLPDPSESCETKSFNPWHAIEAHQPLGGISRVRKEVYQAISEMRHRLNRQPQQPK